MFSPLILVFGLLTPKLAACQSSNEQQGFDYIIVGGGPAGLVLANRLSVDPNITVAIIEAGDEQYNNINVTDVGLLFPGLGTDLDWSYTSAPQKYISNRTFGFSAGKALGGTTTINGMTYIRAEKDQIDVWEELGNEGWNWEALWRYYIGQEGFIRPDGEIAGNGAVFEGKDHGFEGEVAVGWSKYFMKDGVFEILKDTSENMGVKWNKDANGGRVAGFTTWPLTLNSTANIRQDAARAFYYPVAKQRPNLHVLLNTTATRIIWDESTTSSGSATAKGVEVISASTNTTQTILSTHEVILAAGSLRSPALLEHSGIGNPSILSPLNIPIVANLPSVGANLQDQPNTAISYTSNRNWTGYPSFATFLTASDLFGASLSSLASELRANATDYASRIVADAPVNETTVKIEELLIRRQIDLVFTPNSTIPLAELTFFPQGSSFTCVFWNLLPFSRGNIHVTSANSSTLPSINPNFLQLPIDTLLQVAAAVKAREYFTTAPLSQYVTVENAPGLDTVPAGAGWRDERWGAWIKKAYGLNNHPVSSTAMRSKELGGVVDKEGRVYGTGNVRVVDGGILPLQISGHLSATIYAAAGKIADAVLRGKRV
jgi:choline dehydrogenase-like flavoprotein